MLMVSGKMWLPTSPLGVSASCSSQMKYQIPLNGLWSSSTRRCPIWKCSRVEIKQFRSKSTQTLVPRVLGRIAKASTHGPVSPRQTRESFLAEFTTDETRDAAARLLTAAQKFDSTFYWGPSGVSIRGRCSLWPQPITVAWLYPQSKAGKTWKKTRDFTFGVNILERDPAPGERGYAPSLQKWVDGFRDDAFTTDASSKGVSAWWVDYDAAVRHIDPLVDRLSRVLSELKHL